MRAVVPLLLCVSAGGRLPADKVMQGLLDQSRIVGDKRALAIVSRMADYIEVRVNKQIASRKLSHHWETLNMEFGGMNDVLWQLAAETGNARHRALASLFDKPCVLGTLAAKQDALVGIHANTQFPIVIGGQSRFELTGESELRDAAVHFFELIRDTRSFATGGSTHGEIWGAPLALGHTLGRTPVGTEHVESCTSHNMLKVVAKLLEWDGDLQYSDFYESLLLNGVLGTQRGTETGAML